MKNRNNFYNNTFSIFNFAETPKRNTDFISKSGSKYWYDDDGVYRQSNHWSELKLCINSNNYNWSGGLYLAFNLAPNEIPDEINSNDNESQDFWETDLNKKFVIGKGNTSFEAEIDLINKL